MIMVGTRPEAIKMAPVYQALNADTHLETITVNSRQHDELIDQVFEVFDWQPDYICEIKRTSNNIKELYTLLFYEIDKIVNDIKPDYILVHGDTATTAVTSVVACLNGIELGHVEAGLRSHNKYEPWPEEINRRITDILADTYFAPTEIAKQNLLQEGLNETQIFVTGNTVVDALLQTAKKIDEDNHLNRQLKQKFNYLNDESPLVLVTGHRRENHGQNIRNVFSALGTIASTTKCEVVFPIHPNHSVQGEIKKIRQTFLNFHIIEPLNYLEFVWLMRRAKVIISDSGGIQEEAPTFNKQVLVTRNVTERPEGLESGFLTLVGSNKNKIVKLTKEILNASTSTKFIENPYGDGKAAERIRDKINELLRK